MRLKTGLISGLRELQDIGWRSILAGSREPGSALPAKLARIFLPQIRRTSRTRTVQLRSDAGRDRDSVKAASP